MIKNAENPAKILRNTTKNQILLLSNTKTLLNYTTSQ